MVDNGLGVDCSVLVTRLLDSYLRETKNISIKKALEPKNYTPLSLFRHYFRTYTNISADTLTSRVNTVDVMSFDDIQPSDLIRAGSSHVALITEVIKKNSRVLGFSYIHSISDGPDNYGVRVGNVNIVNQRNPLEEQLWKEKHRHNSLLGEYLIAPSYDRGIRRLRILV